SVYRFLNHIVFIHLDPDNKDQPLRPAWMSPTGRSAAIEDFDEQARDTIEKLIQSTEVPLLRARFADMVWLLRKNYKMAELAATEYLAAFKQLDDSDNWAYDIAAKFHRANGDMANVQRLGIKKGESLVRQAEACIGKEGQGYFTATHHLAIAIECFRQSGADDAKIQSLHKQLIEWQAKTSGEMKSFSHEVDTSNIVAA